MVYAAEKTVHLSRALVIVVRYVWLCAYSPRGGGDMCTFMRTSIAREVSKARI